VLDETTIAGRRRGGGRSVVGIDEDERRFVPGVHAVALVTEHGRSVRGRHLKGIARSASVKKPDR